MTPQQRNAFILEKNVSMGEKSEVAFAWENISYAVAEQRYEILKDAADELTGKPWHCEAIEELAAITGHNE